MAGNSAGCRKTRSSSGPAVSEESEALTQAGLPKCFKNPAADKDFLIENFNRSDLTHNEWQNWIG